MTTSSSSSSSAVVSSSEMTGMSTDAIPLALPMLSVTMSVNVKLPTLGAVNVTTGASVAS